MKAACRNSTLLVIAETLFILIASTASAQSNQLAIPDNPERIHALELYQHGKFIDALPLFEELSAKDPHDIAVKEAYAWCLAQYAATLQDSEQRKKVRVHARKIAFEAKEMGDNSQILQVLLQMPEDGADPVYSEQKEADDAMRSAEASFSRGDFDKAIAGYMEVLKLDPKNYAATLFLGDVYFKQNSYDQAGEWFAKAIQIDPNRETAYRYWGDALARAGKNDEARTRFIQAIVADPYNQRSWVGLSNWLHRNNLALNNVQLKDASQVTAKDDAHINITLSDSFDANDPNATAWTTYAIARAAWHGETFKKEFPHEQQYRRTLKEEADALSVMITVLKEGKHYKDDYKKLDPSLQALIKIQEEGFLDPFVLLNRADSDIAKDYEPYRADHRDIIQRYLSDFVVPQTPH